MPPALPDRLAERSGYLLEKFLTSTLARLWPSGSVAEGIGNAFLERWAEFLHLAWMARHGKTLFLPEMSPYSGECVAEGGAAFVIPGRAHNRPACLRAELCGEQGHEGEQPEQARGRACDGQVGPLALGLNAQMRPGLLERGLHLPALHEPAQDLVRILVGIGAEQGLRIEPAQRVTDQHPPDRHDGHPSIAPDRLAPCWGAGAQVNGAL